jgi:ABC-type molybdenum transport system ATPase subunit/photorepair protein PhrA
VASREKLKDLVARTIQGFRPDILVQAVSAQATAHTQVLLLTHRPEEIVHEMTHVTMIHKNHHTNHQSSSSSSSSSSLLQSIESFDRQGLANQALFVKAFRQELANKDNSTLEEPWNDDHLGLPSVQDIADLWQSASSPPAVMEPLGKPLIVTHNLTIQRGDATLLHDLNWQVKAGERWLVAGGNGSSKSTLTRLIATQSKDQQHHGMIDPQSLTINCATTTTTTTTTTSHRHLSEIRPGIGWVSTERHMKTSQLQDTTRDILMSYGRTPEQVALAVAQWMNIHDDTTILDRPFVQLSQGQQKMVLLASAIATRPSILIFDEPCQGLDWMARRRLLGVVERICQATNTSVLYITHHLEELIPSMTHVLHLDGGQQVYQGPIEDYDSTTMPSGGLEPPPSESSSTEAFPDYSAANYNMGATTHVGWHNQNRRWFSSVAAPSTNSTTPRSMSKRQQFKQIPVNPKIVQYIRDNHLCKPLPKERRRKVYRTMRQSKNILPQKVVPSRKPQPPPLPFGPNASPVRVRRTIRSDNHNLDATMEKLNPNNIPMVALCGRSNVGMLILFLTWNRPNHRALSRKRHWEV